MSSGLLSETILRAASGEGKVHMAWSFVVHKYFQRPTKWLLTSFGRLTIMDAKIPRHAAISGLVRVVSHIIWPMYFRHSVRASFFSLALPSSSPSFSSMVGGALTLVRITSPSLCTKPFSFTQCRMYLDWSHQMVPSPSLVILAPRKSIPSSRSFPGVPTGRMPDCFITYLAKRALVSAFT